ncbi:hypothetical protein NKV53_06595 [Legionella sp. 27cVA30]|uniref:DUF6680 family protein n=1 Tax=Legionella sp. 27cVA30 TaxID=2905657 RepID=UPI00209FAF9A|nr:DUF6680 family protein [Legionella sp. 27cVA30]MCP0914018.1 hypothetical protein [Legionella sp. 27cVA30]
MDLTSILTIIAILVGPIAAVQVQKLKERYSEKKNVKLNIFKTLMATRGARLSLDHVRALNMIDTEFYDEREITDAWKCYLDCLCQQHDNSEQALASWVKERDRLFVSLLGKMASSLKYHFDDVHLRQAVYTPKAYGQEEEYQYYVREGIKKIISGEQSISVKLTDQTTH